MSERVAEEIKRRINVAVRAYAYEFKNTSLVSDADFDEECKKVDVSIRTGNPVLDEFFSTEFVDYSGVWVRRHPDLQGLERIYQIKRNSKEEGVSRIKEVEALVGILYVNTPRPSLVCYLNLTAIAEDFRDTFRRETMKLTSISAPWP